MGAALDASNQLSNFIPNITRMVANGHTAIIVLASIAIAATLIMGTAILIRQRKILRKLDELTKEAPQILEKGDINHAE